MAIFWVTASAAAMQQQIQFQPCRLLVLRYDHKILMRRELPRIEGDTDGDFVSLSPSISGPYPYRTREEHRGTNIQDCIP
jgi:hypothetical protein